MGKNAIENAEEIIEAFGGIRPMAKKIDVAVTTVQGWKKRNVIPAARRELIIKAAAEHDVDLGDLLSGSGEVVGSADVKADKPVKKDEKPVVTDRSNDADDQDDEGDVLPEAIVDVPEETAEEKDEEPSINNGAPVKEAKPIGASEKKILDQKSIESFDQPSVSSGLKFVLVVAVIVALGFGSIAAYFWQKANTERAAEAARVEAARIAELEAKMAEVEDEVESKGFFGKIIPKDLNEQIATLQEKTQNLQKDIGSAAQKAQETAKAVSEDVLAEDAGNMEERLVKLETHLQEITGRPVLAGVLDRVNTMQSDPNSEDVLARTVKELDALFAALQADTVQAGGAVKENTDDAINFTLDVAREQSAAIGQTFESVPQDDLKAAAMLLGMAQLRSALNRDNEAFESDLSLLRKIVGDENPELNAALERLAPHAQDGVLTVSGLSTELRSFAGDAVAASLAGEDVTVKERAKARMNELFQVQKDGELITGTETQAALVSAEQQLQNGDIQAAMDAVGGLDGPAAEALLPWLQKAQASLSAQNAKGVVDDVLGSITAVGKGSGGKLIRNEETGINIYVPKNNTVKY
ncbi:MAG: hypothetical protein GW778_05090 [Alphaproteobacteria bacterium]|nr:hypothetical protein [Alphaproteobacteria bacterium]